MNTRYLIFLDIDNVLVTENYTEALFHRDKAKPAYKSWFKKQDSGYKLDPICLIWLEAIVKEFNPKIVIISKHRKEGLRAMKAKLPTIAKYIVGLTEMHVPISSYAQSVQTLGTEITYYLREQDYKGKYLIITSNNNVSNDHYSVLVQTDPRYGINIKAYNRVNYLFTRISHDELLF